MRRDARVESGSSSSSSVGLTSNRWSSGNTQRAGQGVPPPRQHTAAAAVWSWKGHRKRIPRDRGSLHGIVTSQVEMCGAEPERLGDHGRPRAGAEPGRTARHKKVSSELSCVVEQSSESSPGRGLEAESENV